MSLNIDNLPPELLEKIFDYLPKANDRRRVAQVCRTFYRIVRHQSKKFSTLYIAKKTPDKSPVQVFKNSTTFPFSKLHVGYCAPDIIQDLDFWQEHGQYITELTIDDSFSIRWLTLFPYLKKLKLDGLSLMLIDENVPKIQLPVEELCIECGFSMNETCYILQCCPSLKSVELFMGRSNFKRFAEILPWIESIDTVKMIIHGGVQLKEILELPSTIVLHYLEISADTNVESIASFFNKPRLIETLLLDFDSYDNASNSLFTKNKILLLLKAESIKKLVLSDVPEFPGSLDLLAQVPGLQQIHIVFKKKISLPSSLYWSSPNTASKINEIEFRHEFHPEVLIGLNFLSSLTIGNSNGNLEVLRNHPKLKKLVIHSFDYGDVELEPISSLHDLEILELNSAPNVTSAAFKTIIKFPKLKKLVIPYGQMNTDVTMLLPENCPSLEVIQLLYGEGIEIDKKDSLNDAGLERLIRALLYLKEIKIYGNGKRHTVSQEKIQQIQMEFPYFRLIFR